MQMQSLQEIWVYAYNAGYICRKSSKDGLATWQPLKRQFSAEEYKNCELPISDKILSLMNQLVVGDDEADLTDSHITINGQLYANTVEKYHFIVQHLRIPYLNKTSLTICKFAQIAYNAGQAKAEHENGGYDAELWKFYEENELGNWRTYI
jgi:hypothetical protein